MPVGCDDLLVERNRLRVVLFLARQRGADQRAAQCARFAAHGIAQVLASERAIAGRPRELRELAVVVRDLARLRAAQHFQLAARIDGLLPLLLALVDADELLERGFGERRAVAQLANSFSARSNSPAPGSPRPRKTAAWCRCASLRLGRASRFSCTRIARSISPRRRNRWPNAKVRLERIVVDLRHLHEQLERFVRAATQHEIQTANVVGADTRRQIAVAVGVELVDEAHRTEHDEQRGQQERGVGWYVYGAWGRLGRRFAACAARLRRTSDPASVAAFRRRSARARVRPTERRAANRGRARSANATAIETCSKRTRPDIDVDRLGVAVGEDARQQHQHEQDGDEDEPAQRYQGRSFRA